MNNPAHRVNFFGCGLFLWSLIFVQVHVELVEQGPPMRWMKQLLKEASSANLQAALQEVLGQLGNGLLPLPPAMPPPPPPGPPPPPPLDP